MAIVKIFFGIILIGVVMGSIDARKRRMCFQYSETPIKDSEEYLQSYYDNLSDYVAENSVKKVVCSKDFDFCFSLWTFKSNETKTLKQGCWQQSDNINATCKQTECRSLAPTNGHMYYCCCSEDYCNQNMTFVEPIDVAESVISKSENSNTTKDEISIFAGILPLIFLVFAVIIALTTAIVLIWYRSDATELEIVPAGSGYSSNSHYVDNLKLCSMIGGGRYGTVWKGMINEQPVAVKIFQAHHKQFFINERNIYLLPFMDCPSLLEYFGCDERKTLEDRIEHILIFSLAPLGCLQDWLAENTTEYSVFCKMAKSVTRGLSHLHTELKWGNDKKPCVCHRDLNTRNILVKADLSCCIADFGFAIKVSGTSYEYNGQIANTETNSISEVGTVRYMSPEILEGAVNLRDCESSLKQIDVYSLGLVLWELCTRCEDFYPHGESVPPYMTPYEDQVGKEPTFQQMQTLVAGNRERPRFPTGWGSCPPSQIAKDTCEDCWDDDPEARLTSLCAEERIHQLSYLRPLRSRSPLTNASITLQETCTEGSHSLPVSNIFDSTSSISPRAQNRYSQHILNVSKDCTSPLAGKSYLKCSQQSRQGYNFDTVKNLESTSGRKQQVITEKSKVHNLQQKCAENSFSSLTNDVSIKHLSLIDFKQLQDLKLNVAQGFHNQNTTEKPLRGWHTVRSLIQNRFFRNDNQWALSPDEKSNLVDNSLTSPIDTPSPTKELTVNFIDKKNSGCSGTVQTKVEASYRRPDNLDLTSITIRVNGLSPENKPNLNSNISLKQIKDKRNSLDQNEIINDDNYYQTPRIVVSKSANAVKNLNNCSTSGIETNGIGSTASVTNVDEKHITRQRSLEKFREVFSGKGSTEKLRDPSQRVKTPGDVPPSVRKVRASKTLSLYDDRMMDSSQLNAL